MTLSMIPVPLLRLLCSTYTVLVTDLSTEPRSKPCQMVWQERGDIGHTKARWWILDPASLIAFTSSGVRSGRLSVAIYSFTRSSFELVLRLIG